MTPTRSSLVFLGNSRFLIKCLRMNSMKIICFLGDGFAISNRYTSVLHDFILVRNSFKNAGFVF